METLITTDELRDFRQLCTGRCALVPTMGALHEGHLQLVREAQKVAEHVIVSIFVNPKQFAPNEDFARYPRRFAEDCAMLASLGVSAVYVPNTSEMYPEGFQTGIVNHDLALRWCGASRPAFFGGVQTVVLKLLNLTQPHLAVFGKKDFQQLTIIRRMVEDLHLPVRILAVDTCREPDGLAMSSRNQYLTVDERTQAPLIHQQLMAMKQAYESSDQSLTELRAKSEELLSRILKIDYLAICDQRQLIVTETRIKEPGVILFAGWLGQTRLIDNIELSGRP